MMKLLLSILLITYTISVHGQESDQFDPIHENNVQNVCRSTDDLRLDSIIQVSYDIDAVSMDTLQDISFRQYFNYEWDNPFLPSMTNYFNDSNEQIRISYTYDDDGNRLTDKTERFEETIGEWVLQRTEERVFSNGLLEEYTRYNYENGMIVFGAKDEFEYDQNGNRTFRRYHVIDLVTEEFILSSFYCYNYDPDTGLLETLVRKSDDGPSAVPTSQGRYVFENGFLVDYYFDTYDDDLQEFVPFSATSYTVDDQGFRLSQTRARYINMEWVNSTSNFYTYDDCGNQSTSSFYAWDSDLQEWVIRSLSTFYYSGTSSLTELGDTHNLLIFPNPARDYITINVDGDTNQERTVIITDASGKRVAVDKIISSTRINVSNWMNGWYYYQTISEDAVVAGKFLKL